MVSSVFNSASVFSLLASRNQQYKAVRAVAHHVCTSSDYYYYHYYYYYYYYFYCYYYHHYYYHITSVKLYKIKYIYKNQAQLQKAGQQEMIKTYIMYYLAILYILRKSHHRLFSPQSVSVIL